MLLPSFNLTMHILKACPCRLLRLSGPFHGGKGGYFFMSIRSWFCTLPLGPQFPQLQNSLYCCFLLILAPWMERGGGERRRRERKKRKEDKDKHRKEWSWDLPVPDLGQAITRSFSWKYLQRRGVSVLSEESSLGRMCDGNPWEALA